MIEVLNLVKKYGKFEAVRDVSFKVEDGNILGFLGPNGAGKTTIMKILTGYHFPTSGRACVDGISVEDDPVRVKALIGYLPENAPLYGELTVREYLSFIADARLIVESERKDKIEAAIKMCALEGKADKRIDTLSKGYKQRAGLAQAILHDPPILILDEPTTGLDPNQIIEIRALIKELGKRKTVVLSTHIMQEVEAVCNQVLILNEGKIAAQGTPSSIGSALKGGENWSLLVKTPGGGDSLESEDSCAKVRIALEKFAETEGDAITIEKLEESGEALVDVRFLLRGASGSGGAVANENANGEKLFDWAVSRGFKLLSINRKTLSLEDIFVKLTREEV